MSNSRMVSPQLSELVDAAQNHHCQLRVESIPPAAAISSRRMLVRPVSAISVTPGLAGSPSDHRVTASLWVAPANQDKWAFPGTPPGWVSSLQVFLTTSR